MKNTVLQFLFTVLAILRVQAQGTFQNLDFESKSLSPDGPPGTTSTLIGLPGWDSSLGGSSLSTILYNDGTSGGSSIAILGSGNSLTPVIDGSFSVMLAAGAGSLPSVADVSIYQTGLVPADAHSVLFKAYTSGGTGDFSHLLASVNGRNIGLSSFGTASGYTLLGGDVSAVAGQSVDFAITAQSIYPPLQIYVLDSISFSAQAIPEPSTRAFMGAVGSLFLGWRFLRGRCIREFK